jgi:hypothetical protein
LKLVIQRLHAGWADALISDGRDELVMHISYISDGIGEMAAAAKALLQGARETKFAFQDEPGEHVFILTRGADDRIKIDVFENQRNFQAKPTSLVMTIDCAVLDFVGQVYSTLHSLRNDHGDGYKNIWRHDFPLEAYEFIGNT